MPFSLRVFKKTALQRSKPLRSFLTKLERTPPRGLDTIAEQVDKEVWAEMDCLLCGNCCKTMTPTFKRGDIIRIADHLGMTTREFKDKWLTYDDEGKDLINEKQPCQFLNRTNNLCSIYEVRPADCAGFPYLKKKRMVEYIHVHKQNVEYCPATVLMVEKMIARSREGWPLYIQK